MINIEIRKEAKGWNIEINSAFQLPVQSGFQFME